MAVLDKLELTYIITAFLFQVVLIAHFSIRKWRFDLAIRLGPIVYALGIPAAAVSVVLLAAGKAWSFWLAGFLYLIWAVFGYWAEYIRKIEWRSPVYWPVFVPYLILYLAVNMFYWFPLALLWKPFLYIYAPLYVISTILNVTSHKRTAKNEKYPSD